MQAQIFIDAENVRPELGFRAIEKFSRDYSVTCVDIIGREETMAYRYKTAGNPCRVQNCFFGKNSADTWLCVEIAKTVYENPATEVIIIVSNDRDFLPAIKLAADKKKSVIFVSSGIVHKNLRKFLRELKVDMDFVKLIDYHDELTIPIDEGVHKKKRSLSELMKDVKPVVIDSRRQKLESFYMQLSDDEVRFLRKREDQIRFIFIKRGNNFVEVPFITGMSMFRFTAILRELKVIGKKVSGLQAANENFLKVVGDSVCFYREEEFQETPIELLSKFSGLSKASRKYFIDNARKVRTVFINHAGKLAEVPFVDGITLENFGGILRELKVIGKNTGVKKVSEVSLLTVRENRIYLQSEDELMEAMDTDTRSIANFLAENKDEVKKIFVKRNRKIYEVPFVNGMRQGIFFCILKNRGIVNRSVDVPQVIRDSFLDLIDGQIYFQSEERLFDSLQIDFGS